MKANHIAAILLIGWILSIVWVSSGKVCVRSLRSRLFYLFILKLILHSIFLARSQSECQILLKVVTGCVWLQIDIFHFSARVCFFKTQFGKWSQLDLNNSKSHDLYEMNIHTQLCLRYESLSIQSYNESFGKSLFLWATLSRKGRIVTGLLLQYS